MSDEALSLTQATALLTAPGSMFETERVSVKGIEMTVWKQAPATLRQVLDRVVGAGQRVDRDRSFVTASTT